MSGVMVGKVWNSSQVQRISFSTSPNTRISHVAGSKAGVRPYVSTGNFAGERLAVGQAPCLPDLFFFLAAF